MKKNEALIDRNRSHWFSCRYSYSRLLSEWLINIIFPPTIPLQWKELAYIVQTVVFILLLPSPALITLPSHTLYHLQEAIKPVLKGQSQGERDCALQTLWTCVDAGLRILSPFMPYLTEELYQRLPRRRGKRQSVMECDYPRPEEVCCVG